MTLHKYGMRLRGFSPGAQPKGVVLAENADKITQKYYNYIYYAEKLSEKDRATYDLDYLGEAEKEAE